MSRRLPLLLLRFVEKHLVAQDASGVPAIGRAPSADPSDAHSNSSPARFAYVYRVWFGHVVRWLATLGAPRADIEDLAQEVFLVVRRRLDDFDGRNAAGWLYRIASGQVRQHRRRVVFRAIFSRQEPVELDTIPHERPSALAEMETKQERQFLEHLLSRLSEKRRVVFRLFELQGYSGPEISSILDIPVNTVKTRLHYARKDFARLLGEHRPAGGLGHVTVLPPKHPRTEARGQRI